MIRFPSDLRFLESLQNPSLEYGIRAIHDKEYLLLNATTSKNHLFEEFVSLTLKNLTTELELRNGWEFKELKVKKRIKIQEDDKCIYILEINSLSKLDNLEKVWEIKIDKLLRARWYKSTSFGWNSLATKFFEFNQLCWTSPVSIEFKRIKNNLFTLQFTLTKKKR